MKKKFIGSGAALMLIWSSALASASLTTTATYKLSVTIPEHIQGAIPHAPQQTVEQTKNDTKAKDQETTQEEVIRDHQRVLLQTVVTK